MASQLSRARARAPHGDAAERAELAERIGAEVLKLDGVAGLTAGPRARVVTYRIGKPFTGVAVREDDIEVGVVARPGLPMDDIGEAVRRAVLPLAGGRPVNVLIGDIDEGAGGE